MCGMIRKMRFKVKKQKKSHKASQMRLGRVSRGWDNVPRIASLDFWSLPLATGLEIIVSCSSYWGSFSVRDLDESLEISTEGDLPSSKSWAMLEIPPVTTGLTEMSLSWKVMPMEEELYIILTCAGDRGGPGVYTWCLLGDDDRSPKFHLYCIRFSVELFECPHSSGAVGTLK